MKKIILGLTVLLIFPAFVFGNGAQETQDVVVGAIAARSGDNASLGEWQKNGALIAIDEVNESGGILGGNLKVVFEDSQGNPSQAVTALNKLLYNDKVVAIFGDPQSSCCLAMLPVIEKAGIPMLPHGTNPAITKQGNPWVFRTRASDVIKFGYLAEYLLDAGYKRPAILHGAADYGVGGKDSVVNKLSELGSETAAIEQWTPGDKDYNSQLISIRESAPDVLIIIGPMVDMGIAMKQARQMGITVQFAGGAGIESETTFDASSGASNGVLFTAGFLPVNQDPSIQAFVTEYKSRYNNTLPNDFSATGYDAVKLIAAAINEAGSTDPVTIRAALKEIDFTGVQGTFTYDSMGEGLHSMQVGQVIGRAEYKAIQ